jgi:hypothetical protein
LDKEAQAVTNKDSKHSSPIEFPCDFIVKAMGKNNKEFEPLVSSIVLACFPETKATAFSNRASKDNNYLAISVKVYATSKEQLDALYQKLSDAPEVLMAL